MPQVIDIPEVGQVEFPDSMPDDQIVKAINDNIIPRAKKRAGLISQQKALEAEPSPSVSGAFIDELAGALERATNAQIRNARASSEFVRSGEPIIPISQSAAAMAAALPLSLMRDDKAAGVAEGLANLGSAATTPLSLGIAAGAVLAPAVVIPAATFMAGKDAIDKRGEALEAQQRGDTQEAARLNTEAAGAAAMAGMGAIGGTHIVPDALDSSTILPRSSEVLLSAEKGIGSPPIQDPSRLLPAPRMRMPEFTDSTLGINPEPKALPAPGESSGSILLPESPLGPRTAGYRIQVPPFEERTIPEKTQPDPTSVENLRTLVKLSNESETKGQPYKEPTVSTDLRQLEKVMQRNTVSSLETWADGVIKEKLSGSSSNPYLDPEFLSAALVKGTVLIKRGVGSFEDWSKPMIQQFGRDIQPHLADLFKSATEASGKISMASVELATNPPKIAATGVPLDTPSSTPIKQAFETSSSPTAGFSDNVRNGWRSAANEALPKMTSSDRELGEVAVRSVTSRVVGRDIGEIFAEKVLRGLDLDAKEFGAFVADDNLRWREQDWRDKASAAKDPEDAALFRKAADAVGTVVGAKNSPFETHQDFLNYWARPEVKEAASRYSAMWQEQKDPLFRQASDLDPETPLASRGLVSGLRVNMKPIMEGEKSPSALAVRDSAAGLERIGESTDAEPSVGQSRQGLVRQLATLKRSDPFRNQFTGLAPAYETDLVEMMRNGFGREMPVAAQHEFLRKMIDSGDALPSKNIFEPDISLKGESTQGYLLHLRPWVDQGQRFIQVRKSLAPEYESVVGLKGDKAIHPALDVINKVLTRAAVTGLSEGTTHASNLLSQIITGPGPTSNPIINGLIKSLGRVDLLYSIPRVFLRAMTASREELIKLAEIGAAKPPYGKVDVSASASKRALQTLNPAHWLLDPIDRGVRLVSSDLYDAFERSGWITETSETGKREFINQVGNYNKALQAEWLKSIRNNFQPFVTAVHTFGVTGLRRMGMSAGIRDLTPAQRVAFAADIMGGWIGFAAVVVGLNYLLSDKDASVKDKIYGPAGTKLGDIGWIGSDGKTHTFPAGMISGFARGPRVTGVLAGEEALRRGLGVGEAINQTGQALVQSGLNYVTGPSVRFGSVAATGYAPSFPPHRESPPQPPTDSFQPLKNQVAVNIATALKEASPPIDSAISFGQSLMKGDSWGTMIDEAGKKQLQRYWPKTPSSIQSKPDEDFADIVRKSRLNDFVDGVAQKSRQLPEEKRRDYLEEQIDSVPNDLRKAARDKLKAKGVFKQE